MLLVKILIQVVMNHKILVLMPWLPYPLISGGNQACFNALKAISAYFDVHLIYPGFKKSKDEARISEFKRHIQKIQVHRYPVKKDISYYLSKLKVRLARNKIEKSMEFSPYVFCKEYLYFYIREIINRYNIRLIQCEFLPVLEYVYWLKNDNVKLVYIHHEIRFIRNQQLLKFNSNAYNKGLASFLKQRELLALKEYDLVLTLSDDDCKILKKEGLDNVVASFSIIDNQYEVVPQEETNISLAILGSDMHDPNLIGMMWFCEEILPHIEHCPPIKVIGRWSKQNIEKINRLYPNIVFLGFVPDLASAMRNTVLIVPLTIGSGIRMKILEAAAMGVPVITTSIGVSGLPFENNKDLLIADSPDEFKSSINKVKDFDFRCSLSDSIYKKQKEMFSLETLGKNRLSLLQKLI